MKQIVASLAALLITTPALATPSPNEDPQLVDHKVLVALVERLGVPVYFGHSACVKDPTLYGEYRLDGSALIACPIGNRDERLGTVRHEAWHFYQDLADCNIKDNSDLSVTFAPGIVPPANVSALSKYYTPNEMKMEVEARWVEANYTAHTILVMIAAKAQSCGFKF